MYIYVYEYNLFILRPTVTVNRSPGPRMGREGSSATEVERLMQENMELRVSINVSIINYIYNARLYSCIWKSRTVKFVFLSNRLFLFFNILLLHVIHYNIQQRENAGLRESLDASTELLAIYREKFGKLGRGM